MKKILESFNRLAGQFCRFQARVQNFLRPQRPHRPFGIEFSGADLIGKIADHIRFLCHFAFDANFLLIEIENGFVIGQRMRSNIIGLLCR